MTERGLSSHPSDAWGRSPGSSAVAKGCCRLRRASAGSPLGGPPVQRHRTNQRGQALIEMGLSVVLCVLLTLGIVEFGYIFMALNLITQATSAGARAASVHQMGSRGLCGKITDATAITGPTGIVRSQIGNIATVPNAGVTVTEDPTPNTVTPCHTLSGSDIPKVRVTSTGAIP